MPTSENATLTALRKVADPVERAAACHEFVTNGRETLRLVMLERDDSIRAARKTAHPDARTIDGFAARIKARRNVIVDALRKRDGK